MNRFLEDIIKQKRKEIKNIKVESKRERAVHHIKDYFQKDALNVIAEIKECSPSAGLIRKIDLNEIVPIYQKYAKAISVLSDEKFFCGSFDRLKKVADMVDMPVLCKDFIIDEAQIDLAYANGADIVLLIVRILEKSSLNRLYGYAKSLGMDALVEVHSEDELKIAEDAGCDIIGVNSRDLDTLEISLDRALKILKSAKADLKIAESGIKTKDDIDYLKPFCSGFLIGEGFLKGSIDENFQKLGFVL